MVAISQIAAPFLIGTASWTRGQSTPGGHPGTAQQITPLANIPAGALIYIGLDVVQYPAIPYSITDSAGNTYGPVTPNSYLFASDPDIAVWAAYAKLPVTTAGTITITPQTVSTTNFQEVNAVAVCVPSGAVAGTSGAGMVNAADQAANGFSTGASLVIATDQLAYGGELAIGYWAARAGAGTPLPSSDWASIAQVAGLNTTHQVNVAWKLLQPASPLYARATVPSGGNTGWGGVVVTFMPVVIPSMTMHGGGTLAPYHVAPVSGTMTMHGGGSILGPAELAPIGPPSLPVFPPGYGPVAEDFENWVQQSLGYCCTGTVFRAEQHATQAISASTFTPIAYDTVLEDPFKGWSAVATSAQPAYSWLVPWDATYRITFRYLQNSLSALHGHDPAFGISGTVPAQEGGAVPGAGGDATMLLPLIAGDYVQFLAWCNVSMNTSAGGAGQYASVEITASQTGLLD